MKKTFLFTSILILMPFIVSAATAMVEIDTGTETVNALEGTLKIPTGISVSDIYTGNSAILIWIVKPTLDVKTNTISFAGLTPGGFRGMYPIFSIIGEFESSGLSRVEFSNINALKNDGSGTAVLAKLSLRSTEIVQDIASPEPFEPIISSSPDLFEGKYFVSFSTQDKGTGIERYEYSSSWLLKPRDNAWIETDSPLLLSGTLPYKKIFIRAVDKSGNYRVVSTTGPYYYATLVISIIILLCVLLFLRRSFLLF